MDTVNTHKAVKPYLVELSVIRAFTPEKNYQLITKDKEGQKRNYSGLVESGEGLESAIRRLVRKDFSSAVERIIKTSPRPIRYQRYGGKDMPVVGAVISIPYRERIACNSEWFGEAQWQGYDTEILDRIKKQGYSVEVLEEMPDMES